MIGRRCLKFNEIGMQMSEYTPHTIAHWFLCNIDREAGDSITHLKLQKLVYYAQAWSMVLLEKELFSEDFQAWAHGPVAPSLFQTYRGSGWEALAAPDECPKIKDEYKEVLKDVLATYGQKSAKYLERLTHSEAPWKDARGGLAPEEYSQEPISKASIIKYYDKVYRESVDG